MVAGEYVALATFTPTPAPIPTDNETADTWLVAEPDVVALIVMSPSAINVDCSRDNDVLLLSVKVADDAVTPTE